MKTGFAQVSISEGINFIMGGMFLEYTCDEIHTPLFATAVAFEDNMEKVLWVSCDLGSMTNENFHRARKLASEKTGVPADNILLSLTHTHTGPTMANTSIYSTLDSSTYKKEIIERIAQVCEKAWAGRENMSMGYGSRNVKKCCFNRRYLMDYGQSEMHPSGSDNPHRLLKEGPEDNEMQTVWFKKDEKLAGVIVNFSAHPSIMYGLRVISGDYPGILRKTIQKVYGDVPVLFLLGCCGNTCAINHEENPVWGTKRAEQVGRILASEVIQCLEQPEGLSMKFLRSSVQLEYNKVSEEELEEAKKQHEKWKKGEAKIRVENGMVEDVCVWAKTNKVFSLHEKVSESPYFDAPVSALRIGDIVFVTNPAELFVEYQLAMKDEIPGNNIIVVEKTDGRCVYVPTKLGHMLGGYEIEQGLFDWRAGMAIKDACVALASKLEHT